MKIQLTALTALFLTFTASAAEVIKIDTPELKNTTQEVYSVYCPFCYKYEKSVIPYLVKNLPAGTDYQAICLESKGELGIESCEVLAALGTIDHEKYEKAKLAMFAAIHDQKLKNVKGSSAVKGDLAAIGLKAAGVTQSDFKAALNTPEAQEKLAYDRTISLTIAKVKGIPAIVVNGNKMIDTTTISSLDNLNETIKSNL